MTKQKWLTPRMSKAAKQAASLYGHVFGRLTVDGDTATAKCRNDGCRVVLNVTEHGHELIPESDGVIDCTAKQPKVDVAKPAGFIQITAEVLDVNDLLMSEDEPEQNPFEFTLPSSKIFEIAGLTYDGEPWNPQRDLIDTIEHAIVNHPRSQQTLIGPSEIGTSCDRCLGKKLLGVPQTREVAWLPQVGTAVHDWLDRVLSRCEDCGWLTERQVTVGIIGNRVIRGRCDAFKNGLVADFKVVGANTLKKVKASGPSSEYRTQIHLYGRGYELDGYDVTHVSLLYLPRNSPTLADSIFHIEPYDRNIALAALDRANRIHEFVTADRANILTLDRDPACYDCIRFAPLPGEDSPSSGPHAGDPFAGILS